jgi:hypothetical protein
MGPAVGSTASAGEVRRRGRVRSKEVRRFMRSIVGREGGGC